MPPIRIIPAILIRASRSSRSRTCPQRCLNAQRARPAPVARAVWTQLRWQSQDSASSTASSKAYGFEEIKELVSKPSADRILIDTREPAELQQTGRIPGALNIPITSQADAFFISDEEFEDRFGFERPARGQEVVFYCKAGVRSRAAAQLARQGGWGRTGEYKGSWMDWFEKGGEVQR